MIHVDLEEFVNTGVFGPFSTSSSRQQIVELLGDPEPETYPGVAHYGHLAFDLTNGTGPPCVIQIGFPHPTHMRPANPEWTNWTAPTCFDNWPDQRIEWALGRLVPELDIQHAIVEFVHFEEIEMISGCNGLRILHNPSSRVELCFENDENNGRTTLSSIVAHPNLTA